MEQITQFLQKITSLIDIILKGLEQSLEFIEGLFDNIIGLLNLFLYTSGTDSITGYGIGFLQITISIFISLMAYKIISKMIG